MEDTSLSFKPEKDLSDFKFYSQVCMDFKEQENKVMVSRQIAESNKRVAKEW